ncbi:hypothetical protein L798_13223, partial [Zootermopsis nevadensis]
SCEKLFKVLILGDQSVGKTSYVQRYVGNTFAKDYKETVGVDFAVKVLKLLDATVALQLWDIAGQEIFTWMTRIYCKNSHGCVIMFDLSNRSTLNNAIRCKKEVVDSNCTAPEGKKFPCILIANKCDILDSEKEVTQAEIEQIYREHEFSGWTKTSVKNGFMVNESLRSVLILVFS